ncbi:hypothetical protein RHMOL_Rhmol13G0012800 [Rhododendron molle]|uniref:Uncharacterized protein n=1 Tax=Rhododendron molle TaxID=49168 RepID=A0ACC0L207_RHOML|nr:hypothetical protein RHMOL_Rhmol13G0012800 [Rhododendron molle]
MDSNNSLTPSVSTNHHYANNGKLLLIISLFALVAICILTALFHSYAGWARHRRDSLSHRGPPSDSLAFNSGPTISTPAKEGLERSVLDSIPTFSYDAALHDTPAECAVCLSEFVDKELARVLPNCNHCFHIGCIDMWLYSRSNCPLCRAPATPVENLVGDVTSVGETSGSVDGSDCGLSSSSSSLLRTPPELVGIIVEVPKINLDCEDSRRRT